MNSRDEHRRTTEEVLTELSLDGIPRLLVLNKADLLEPGEGERLLASNPSAVLLSALHRETTRTLLARIANVLEGRWKNAELAPPRDDAKPDEVDPERLVPAIDELTTLEELLGSSRKPPKRAGRRSLG